MVGAGQEKLLGEVVELLGIFIEGLCLLGEKSLHDLCTIYKNITLLWHKLERKVMVI